MALKQVRVLYSARNFTTGLTDVKGQVYLNGVAKAVGGSALSFSELDATNAPGIYFLNISAAQQVTWGAAVGDDLEVVVDSASKPARSEIRVTVTAISTDDLDSHLVTQDTAIAAIKTVVDTVNTTTTSTAANVTTIKSDVEDASTGLAAIRAAIAAVASQVSSVQNNTNFSAYVPEGGFIKPASGSQVYRIPINVQDEKGALKDPDLNSIVVSIANPAGSDQGAIMTGYASGTASAVKDSVGNYHIDVTIPSTATEQELLFTFSYGIGGTSFVKRSAANIINNVQADGFAQQITLTAVQTTANDTNSRVQNVQSSLADSTSGLAALQALLTNATFGLSAQQVLEAAIKTQTDKLGDASIGLAAIKAAVASNNSDLSGITGTGFVSSTDSLHALSLMLQLNLYSGGRAV